MSVLKVNEVSKTFENEEIIENISLELHEGEIVSLLGVSGGGKTTLFNIIAGLSVPDKGEVYLDGENITGKPGFISYMLQKDLLLPYRTILDNVALPLIIRGMKKKEAREKAAFYFEEFGLEGTQKKYPAQLSGGMKQRAALLRTYMFSEKVALLDEPFSALDFQTRLNVCDDVAAILKKEKKTAILVTHDLSEAVSMADRVLVLSSRPGRLIKDISITFEDLKQNSPMNRRNAKEFKSYFNLIWKELNMHDS